jgi:hypothetical protein
MKHMLVELKVNRTAIDPLFPVVPPIPVLTSPMAKSRIEVIMERRAKRIKQTPT